MPNSAAKSKKKKKSGPVRASLDLRQVEELAAIGATQKEIASVLGVSLRTVESRAEEKDFRAALERGTSNLHTSLRRKQVEMALGGDRVMLIWLGKQYLDQREPESDAYVSPGTNIRLFVNQAGMDDEVDTDPPTPEGKVRSKVREA